MKKILFRYKWSVTGFIVGAIGGYIYYHFWGCTNGCTIQSSPVNMTIYGSILGYLLFNLVIPDAKGKNDTNEKKQEA